MAFAAGALRRLGYLTGSMHTLVTPRGAIRRGMLLHRSVQEVPTRRDLLTSRSMTTAYSGDVGDGTLGLDKLASYVPYQTVIKKGRKVEIGPFQVSEGWMDVVLCDCYVWCAYGLWMTDRLMFSLSIIARNTSGSRVWIS
jgi:hypothetical protein